MRRALLIPLSLLALAACDRSTPEPEPEPEPAQQLPEGEDLTLSFTLAAGQSPLSCGAPADIGGATFALTDARFFVHDVRTVDSAGAEHPVTLVAEEPWQSAEVALVDLAGPGCEGADERRNARVNGVANNDDVAMIRFKVGVPFAVNHSDPSEAHPPLDTTAMHWGWRGGYQFVRIDGAWGDGTASMHFGSTRCEGEMRNITSCARPCVADVEIATTSLEPTIVLDVAALLADAPARTNCMGEPEQPGCDAVLAGLNLDAETCTSVGPAVAFRAFAPTP
ncbi:MAG: putative repeat protein (TIGR04052 family) [Bradymonadia bacterium]|jgi:uncharacterized repeat protein (TIGR04052 family)